MLLVPLRSTLCRQLRVTAPDGRGELLRGFARDIVAYRAGTGSPDPAPRPRHGPTLDVSDAVGV